ncbi:methyltransferase domain-containing protein [Methylobacterium tarhaniae]|uniref:class I SAM-dependent methyltransferase n=1 Tax=Methylobacterium tarhaniae TaxID=1187852 RepID=UPI003D090777
MQLLNVAECWEANADAWTRHVRAGFDIYRDALNSPAFLSILPPISGLSGLDIGCGEGTNTRQLARLGAAMQAIDIAPTFIRHAQEAERAESLGISYQAADATNLPFENCSFDFATAFMSFMDIPDQAASLRETHRVLRPGGFLQFSILHPCFVPAHRKVIRDDEGNATAIEIGGYFDRIDGRIDTLWFSALPDDMRAKDTPFHIPRFHRTLSEWVLMINDAEMVIEIFSEPCADLSLAEQQPVVADTRVAPISLIVRVRKPI